MSRHEFTAGALPTKQTAHLQWIIINLFACLFTSPASAGAGGGVGGGYIVHQCSLNRLLSTRMCRELEKQL